MKKNFGKAIRIFLIDGKPNGRMLVNYPIGQGKPIKSQKSKSKIVQTGKI